MSGPWERAEDTGERGVVARAGAHGSRAGCGRVRRGALRALRRRLCGRAGAHLYRPLLDRRELGDLVLAARVAEGDARLRGRVVVGRVDVGEGD
eukprot:4764055-Prymnesium_polylepis.1